MPDRGIGDCPGRPGCDPRGAPWDVVPVTAPAKVAASGKWGGPKMERRDFLKSAGIAATGALAGAPTAALADDKDRGNNGGGVPGPQPNILFVLVDELRFPSVFPAGIDNAGDFLKKFMPNVHSLWERGVKFSRHYTAASACTPARGVLLTGLYSQQTWVCVTLTNTPNTRTPTPILNPAFPTYGKLLRDAGYQTPYIGKWHC